MSEDTITVYRWEYEGLIEEAATLEADNAALRQQLDRAEAWNHAVPVCREHTSELVTIDGCVVCTNAALLAENEKLKANTPEIAVCKCGGVNCIGYSAEQRQHTYDCDLAILQRHIDRLEAERDRLRGVLEGLFGKHKAAIQLMAEMYSTDDCQCEENGPCGDCFDSGEHPDCPCWSHTLHRFSADIRAFLAKHRAALEPPSEKKESIDESK